MLWGLGDWETRWRSQSNTLKKSKKCNSHLGSVPVFSNVLTYTEKNVFLIKIQRLKNETGKLSSALTKRKDCQQFSVRTSVGMHRMGGTAQVSDES